MIKQNKCKVTIDIVYFKTHLGFLYHKINDDSEFQDEEDKQEDEELEFKRNIETTSVGQSAVIQTMNS